MQLAETLNNLFRESKLINNKKLLEPLKTMKNGDKAGKSFDLGANNQLNSLFAGKK